jgi:hypothetical protein
LCCTAFRRDEEAVASGLVAAALDFLRTGRALVIAPRVAFGGNAMTCSTEAVVVADVSGLAMI